MSSEQSINGFMIGCGMTGPLELEVTNRRTGAVERRLYHQPYVLIGRTPAADLPLDDDQVSRRHAYLQVVAGRVHCIDLASRTGLQWEDDTYGSGWLEPGRKLRVGPYVIQLGPGMADDEPSETDMPAADARSKRLPRVLLEFVGPGAAGRAPCPISRRLTLVGRSPLCKVLLSGAEVSRFHCSLVRTTTGLWVVDLLGRRVTSVNGRPIRSRLLGDGDLLEIGDHRVQVRYGRSAAAQTEAQRRRRKRKPPQPEPAPAPSVLAMTPPALPPALPAMPSWPSHGTTLEVKSLLEGRPPEQVELAESLIVPLVNQFGQMQMQMFDQFQQVIMMLFQMFSTMHRDQMEVVREELAQIRRLTEQLQTAQEEIKRQQERQQQAAAAPPSEARPAPRSLPRGGGPVGRGEPRPAPEEPAATPDLHALLTQRIAAIQEERQSRWQKLVQMMGGGSSGR